MIPTAGCPEVDQGAKVYTGSAAAALPAVSTDAARAAGAGMLHAPGNRNPTAFVVLGLLVSRRCATLGTGAKPTPVA